LFNCDAPQRAIQAREASIPRAHRHKQASAL
jgi:hypothetical protein